MQVDCTPGEHPRSAPIRSAKTGHVSKYLCLRQAVKTPLRLRIGHRRPVGQSEYVAWRVRRRRERSWPSLKPPERAQRPGVRVRLLYGCEERQREPLSVQTAQPPRGWMMEPARGVENSAPL